MKGRVVDGSGKPVKGAQVDTGGMEYRDERTPVATDELGEYTLRGCEAGPAIVTAQAEGFGPEFREVNVPNGGEVEAPVIRLGKASTLRVRVVDRAGKPVAGAYLQVGTWRGHRLVAQGRGSNRGCMALHLERSNRCRRALHLDKCPERRHALRYL